MEAYEECDLDRKIRKTLEPDAEAVHRVVDRAIAYPKQRRRSLAPIFATIGICIIAWLTHVRLHQKPLESLTLECVGEVLIIQSPDGTSWIFSEDGREPGPGEETGLILYEGDLP